MEKIGENTIKRLSKIGDRKYHSRYGEFLVEGLRSVEEAFKAKVEIKDLIIRHGEERVARIAELISAASDKGLSIWSVTSSEMSKICRTVNSQGIAAGVKLSSKTTGDLFGEILQYKTGVVVFLDSVQDPGNVGALIRSAEAFGVGGIILGRGSAGLYNPKTIRSTMGAIFRVPVVEMGDRKPEEIIERFKKAGFRILVANISEKATSLNKTNKFQKNLLVIGSEARGVSKSILSIADTEIYISMSGPTESLNASIAGSIFMYELLKQ
ncbi:23S rRNA (guanosine(2251)-2'-O)-methyltransferase RlmB [bacterium]|nr:23S rRNA (guanosine(2251)-2'-O)-methyltransferase RlmB [bacterium]